MKLSLVVPVFNEEQAIGLFHQAVCDHPELTRYDLELLFVDDGSRDGSARILERLRREDPRVVVLQLSRNFGKEAALFAGIEHASGEVVVPLDVDLQDPLDVIPRLLEQWRQGADVVLAKRVDRRSDSPLKRLTAEGFYRLHNRIAQTPIEENVGDFRLMSREVVDAIKDLPERNLFMKGILSWVGFDTRVVEYERAPRSAGSSKFNGWKLWNLALEGFTSFSTVPLRLWTYLGGGVALLSLAYAGVMVFRKLVFGNPVPGYPSLMTAILFFGGVQLIGIGVLGEYIGRIYIETKRRPRYVLKRSGKRDV
ncbi:glycosyltransferase family 2 protein [Pseudomonas oryzihabitans]|uniref:glycosyltransferase family 2 protein n=1 Tax=Pseudomonas oryzihabitans TaxID=47885 RepID=UPI002895A3D2|nr:glycosyltransferase family 2 protein [Pseudomonas oryzihabitans]MDT3718657.1 glycosyltransferase family 2 protein [Pseudomonas oryzihabitans]